MTETALVPSSVADMPSSWLVRCVGTVFFDVVFSDLDGEPRLGKEVYATNLGLSPGGIANVAVALARLGLRVELESDFSQDAFGEYLWSVLSDEGIDLSRSRRLGGWSTPITVSLAYRHERSLVTNLVPPPPRMASGQEGSRRPDALIASLGETDGQLLTRLRGETRLLVADAGSEIAKLNRRKLHQRLANVDVFLPNSREALLCSHRHDLIEAARAIGQHVPLVVIKNGAKGSLAFDSRSNTLYQEDAVIIEEHDTTGAGDVFNAAFVYATLAEWELPHRLRFANLCAATSIRFAGGALSAPCWNDIEAWWRAQEDPGVRRRFAFLASALARPRPTRTCRRSCASLSAWTIPNGNTPSAATVYDVHGTRHEEGGS